jgi:hypothetical protein
MPLQQCYQPGKEPDEEEEEAWMRCAEDFECSQACLRVCPSLMLPPLCSYRDWLIDSSSSVTVRVIAKSWPGFTTEERTGVERPIPSLIGIR